MQYNTGLRIIENEQHKNGTRPAIPSLIEQICAMITSTSARVFGSDSRVRLNPSLNCCVVTNLFVVTRRE